MTGNFEMLNKKEDREITRRRMRKKNKINQNIPLISLTLILSPTEYLTKKKRISFFVILYFNTSI